MEEPLMVLRPNLINALLPLYMLNLVKTLVVTGLLLFTYWLLAIMNVIAVSWWVAILTSVLIILLVPVVPLTWKIIILSNTKYSVFQDHLMREFKFIVVRTHTINFRKITDMSLDVSLWDRICNAGDIRISTGDDTHPDLVLEYMKNPDDVITELRGLIRK